MDEYKVTIKLMGTGEAGEFKVHARSRRGAAAIAMGMACVYWNLNKSGRKRLRLGEIVKTVGVLRML